MKPMRSSLIYLCLLTPFLFLMSCASYNYTSSSNDRSFKITSDNLPDFQVFSTKSSNKLSTASSGAVSVRLESLKKDYLSVLLSHPNYNPQQIFISRTPRAKALAKDVVLGVFTFGIPIIVDVFKSDFYKISPKTKEFQVHFEFKQSFMSDEYTKIKDSKNPDDFKDWLSKYQKSALFQKVLDQKDSLELTIALFQETEQAIDDYIASHQSSTHLPEALKIKEEMVAARELFAKTKTENSVSSYESFLEKYPRSLHNKEAHKLLTDAAEKVAVSSSSSTSMVNYMKNYFIPNAAFFNTSELDQRKSKISKAIDGQLIKENIKTDPKKTYDYYSNLWKAYINMRNQGLDPYLTHLEQTYSYQSKICDVLFLKVKDANTADKQSTLIAKINSDFPSLDIYDASKSPIITTLENMKKGTGVLKLFNVGYLPYYFNNMSERDALIGREYYNYKDSTHASLRGITYEEISFTGGSLNGVSKAYKGNQLDLALNMNNNTSKDISYYQNGTLVMSTFFPSNESPYYYEYENGANLTLKVINDVMAQLNSIESNVRGYIKTKNYEQMAVEYRKIEGTITPATDLLIKNPIPKEKGINVLMAKAKVLDGLLNTAVANKNTEEKAAQEKRTKELLALWSAALSSSSSSTSSNSNKQVNYGQPNAYQCVNCLQLSMGNSKPLAFAFGGCSPVNSRGVYEERSNGHMWREASTNCEYIRDRGVKWKDSSCGLQCRECGVKNYLFSDSYADKCLQNKDVNSYGNHKWKEY